MKLLGESPNKGALASRGILVLVATLGLAVSTAASAWVWSQERARADSAVASRVNVITESMQHAVDHVSVRLLSLAGLYQASEEVTGSEFRTFVDNMDTPAGVIAVAYAPVLRRDMTDTYTEWARDRVPGYSVFALDEWGNRVDPPDGYLAYPVLWTFPERVPAPKQGFDLYSHPEWRVAVDKARLTRSLVATGFLDMDGDGLPQDVALVWTVTDEPTTAVKGVAIAAVDLRRLLERQVVTPLAQSARWTIRDATYSLSATDDPSRGTVTVGGRVWEVSVIPIGASALTPDPRSALLVLLVGVGLTLLVAGALHLRRVRVRALLDIEQLQEITQSKDRFLASVSHELRTPLTGIVGFVQLLVEGSDYLSEEERTSMLASVASEAGDLAGIIDDLLVAARAELDLVTVTRAPVDALAQIDQILATTARDIADRVGIVGPESCPTAMGDPARVRQILRNLLSNADRYGGDRIEIEVTRTEGGVAIEVRDNGAGIGEESAGMIFEPYYRAHSQETQPAAIGIGLSVSRHLARLMDGDLTYRREAGWSVFRLELPAAATDRVAV